MVMLCSITHEWLIQLLPAIALSSINYLIKRSHSPSPPSYFEAKRSIQLKEIPPLIVANATRKPFQNEDIHSGFGALSDRPFEIRSLSGKEITIFLAAERPPLSVPFNLPGRQTMILYLELFEIWRFFGLNRS